MIAGYVLDDALADSPSGREFVDAIDRFAHTYADLVDVDHTAYLDAIRAGTISTRDG